MPVTGRTLPALAVILPLVLGGCAFDAFSVTKEGVGASHDDAAQSVTDAQAGDTVVAGQVYTHHRAFGGGLAIANIHGDPLPPKAQRFSLNSMGADLQLRDIATEITVQTLIPVDLVDDLLAAGATKGTEAGRCHMAPDTGKDSLPVFLDALATWCDLTWSYRQGRLKIQQYETATYSFYAQPTETNLKTAMSSTGMAPTTISGSAGSGQGGGASAASGQSLEQTSNSETRINIWKEVQTILAGIAQPGRVEISPATHTILVVAKHSAQVQIKALVDELNRRQLRQVTFTVRVLDVNSSNNLDLGLSLSALYNNLQGQYRLSGASPANLAGQVAGVGSFSLTVQNNTLTGKTNNWNASGAVIDALQNVGNVATRDTITANTLDARPVVVTVARQLAYFSGSQTSQATSTTVSTVQESTLTVGLSIQLLPTILDDGEIILQYDFGLSSLNGLNPTQQGNVVLNAPDINVRSSMQHALVSSGDALVLLGYQQNALNETEQGLPGLAEGLFGFFAGGKTMTNSRAALVIIITPQLRQNGISGQ